MNKKERMWSYNMMYFVIKAMGHWDKVHFVR